MWKVLLVEPWTPGHAPVARLYQPAPVFGGAWVSRPLPLADVPFFRNDDIVGSRPFAAYFATRSWRMPSAAKKTAVSSGAFSFAAAEFDAAAVSVPAAGVANTSSTAIALKSATNRNRTSEATPHLPGNWSWMIESCVSPRGVSPRTATASAC